MDTDASLQWLRSFEAQKGRPLRVLHVGNIANNAYLNAKFLRSVGVEAHVVCRDFDHVMATPEWEEVELTHGHGDDFHPVFSPRDLRGYRRPYWFVSGSLPACAARIDALWGATPSLIQRAFLGLSEGSVAIAKRLFGSWIAIVLRQAVTEPSRFAYNVKRVLRSRAGSVRRRLGGGARQEPSPESVPAPPDRAAPSGGGNHPLIAEFKKLFPQRPDALTFDDIVPYRSAAVYFQRMFRHYDIIQCYATDPIFALLADQRPYVAFEHGTLRAFTMDDLPLHRLTALSYRKADHVFITNGDCLAYAKRLNIETYSPIIHPIDVGQHRRSYGDAIAELRREFDADVVLFCPTRHDWDIKGTDRFIRALPLIKQRIPGRVKLVLVRWGLQVAESEALIEELGCSGDVVWRTTMSRISMIKHIRAADVVFDQMVLPVFGATAPQAIAAGKPVVASYLPEQTQWIIPEPAPTLCAYNIEEISDSVVKALDPVWLADYEHRARRWIDLYHHPRGLISAHLGVYRDLIERFAEAGSISSDGVHAKAAESQASAAAR